jgi:KaiC/GvpD/RAD55 family RecA-like ATPase
VKKATARKRVVHKKRALVPKKAVTQIAQKSVAPMTNSVAPRIPAASAPAQVTRSAPVQTKALQSTPAVKRKVPIAPKPTMTDRIPSGIPGLDEVIEGGFEKNSAVLVSGGGGSGKTIFGIQFLLEGINKFDETGVYISFEENKEKFYKHMMRFGWDLEKLENQGRFVFIRYSPEKMAEMVEMGGKTIGQELKEINGKRIVIDSLSAYTVLFDKESDQRRMLVELFAMIEGWDATTVVIAEENPNIKEYHSSVMGFMADAIIYLYNIIKDNTLVRAMQIAKMRGTKHTSKIFPLLIGERGVNAYPDQDIFEHDFGKK